ncbi:MAG TPA: hypothetical protein ENK48_07375 [Gammaproteobacteria bacterium]|nr:hypothetical protein [Gammaproteobacteria bacterium]
MRRGKGRRRGRREVLRRFEADFDLARLDYPRRVRIANGKARLHGVLAAFLLYSAGFAVGYYGWSQGHVGTELFGKAVWLLMLPATVVGVFVWLLARNRLEYPVRRDISDYIASLEGKGGRLWRYAPAAAVLCPGNLLCKSLMARSREGEIAAIDPEDYGRVVHELHHALREADRRALDAETLEALARNLEERGPSGGETTGDTSVG